MNQINPATANGSTVANAINEIGERVAKIEMAGQAMVYVPKWHDKFRAWARKMLGIVSGGFIEREMIEADFEISDFDRKTLLRHYSREEYVLSNKRTIVMLRHAITKMRRAHCITQVHLRIEYRDSTGMSDEVGMSVKGDELSLLTSILDLPGLTVKSTHPGDM